MIDWRSNYRLRWAVAVVFVALLVFVIAVTGHGGPAHDDVGGCAPRCLP